MCCVIYFAGYVCRQVLLSSFSRRGGDLTEEQKSFNVDMSIARVSIENIFGRVCNLFQNLNNWSYWKIDLNHPGDFYFIAVMLTNMLTCLRGGNQVSDRFLFPPPTLNDYLSYYDL